MTFRKGGRLECSATVRGEKVFVETASGRFAFPRGDFVSIRPSDPPEKLWPKRLEAALRGDAQDRADAVYEAMENGLTTDCESLLRRCARIDRDRLDPALARMLSALDRLKAGRPEPDLRPLTHCLPGRFDVAQGPLFLLLHRKTAAEAEARLALLEQVASTFMLWSAAHGFELPAPDRKLVCVWFDNRRDYANFLDREGAGGLADTSGYFHPGRRLIALCDSSVEPSLTSAASSNPSADDSARLCLLAEQTRQAIDLGASAHETIHLLVSETGFSPRCDSFPLWLHEGLAMQFEAIRFGRWAGVSRISPIRLAHLRRLPSRPRLSPLIRDDGFDRGYSSDRYAQAWSLVYYLSHARPRAFFSYLDQLRVPVFEPSADPSSRFSALFQTCFGADLPALERSWISSSSSIRSPLDPLFETSFPLCHRRFPD